MPADAPPSMGCIRIWYPRLTSTMDVAMALGAAGAPHGTLVETGEQTAGRGRLGRRWETAPGSALLGSWVMRAPSGVELSAFSPAVAAAVLRTVLALAPGAPVEYKWPNDVLVDGLKIAGILLTARATRDVTVVIAGTGINVSRESMPPELPATCLAAWADAGIADVRERLASELDAMWSSVMGEGALSQRDRELLEARMALRGRPVEVMLPDGAITGVVAGLTPDGGLRLGSLEGGAERVLHVGEIARGPRPAAEVGAQTAVYLPMNEDR